jgi:DNA-binding protein YbaB
MSDLADFERMSELGSAVYGGLEKVRVTTDSADGLVTVVVGGRGEVLELELDPRIYHAQDARALAAKILETIQAACEEAAHESVKVLDDVARKGPARQRALVARMREALVPDDDQGGGPRG